MSAIDHRRALHQIPELGDCLPKTMAYLEKALSSLGCRVFSPAKSSLCAFFDFGRDSAIAFRADCDALPILEKTGADFASTHEGKMHACGHDGHMAVLLELAERLSQKKALSQNVLLIFQPAEETTGGAKPICDSGVLEEHHVKAVFGLHLWPGLAEGVIHSRKKELMARTSELKIDIYGRSCHIAKASDGLDALSAGVTFYTRARELEASFGPEVFRVLNFGKMVSGTVRNAVSAHTELQGTIRAFQDEVFDALRDGLFSIGKAVEAETGCRVVVDSNEGYPAVMNPPELYDKVMAVAPFEALAEPSMTAEDFSMYQKWGEAMFFFLGTGDTPALHADTFHFNEQILLKGADFFEKLAENFL